MRIIWAGLLALVGVLGLAMVLQGGDFFMFRFWAPKYENVRRQVFEQTKSYNQGTQQELENMRFEYIKADPAHKAALGSIILHRAADYPTERMSSDMQQFINELRRSP